MLNEGGIAAEGRGSESQVNHWTLPRPRIHEGISKVNKPDREELLQIGMADPEGMVAGMLRRPDLTTEGISTTSPADFWDVQILLMEFQSPDGHVRHITSCSVWLERWVWTR